MGIAKIGSHHEPTKCIDDIEQQPCPSQLNDAKLYTPRTFTLLMKNTKNKSSGVAPDNIIDDGTYCVEGPSYESENPPSDHYFYDREDPNGSQIVQLRITGTICTIFGVIEIGIGSYLFAGFSNAQAGAWWSVLLVVIAGVLGLISTTRFQVSFTLIFSAVGAIIAVIGAATDGVASNEVRSLTACGTKSSADSSASFYGASDDYPMATLCMTVGTTKKIFNEGICYCSDMSGNFCGVYTISDRSILAGSNCGYILSNYSPGLSASAAFCALSATAAITLAIICFIILNFPDKRLKSKSGDSGRRDDKREISPEFGVSSASYTNEDINYH